MTQIRLAITADLPAINDIYNYYVDHSTCTYQTEHETLTAREAWFHEHPADKYPVTVAEIGGAVVGWGSLSKFRPRAAYAPTVEASVYIHHEFHRRGLGRMLLTDLIARARAAGFPLADRRRQRRPDSQRRTPGKPRLSARRAPEGGRLQIWAVAGRGILAAHAL
jgi:L-amino acid N-acyltransferase YncA